MALTERYVTESGAGAQNGNDLANAFSIGQAINELNTSPSGYRYNLKGTFNLASGITITGNGAASLFNVICGYNSTPGDGCLGRDSNGFLDESNMAIINFTSASYRFQAGTANYLMVQGIKVSGSYAFGEFFRSPNIGEVYNCIIINNTNSNGNIADATSVDSLINNCDILSTTTNTANNGCRGVGPIIGSRISMNSGVGINLSSQEYLADNIIYNCSIGINKTSTSNRVSILNNTISNCSIDGINIGSSHTPRILLIGNHITGCARYGVNLNTPATHLFINTNRFRDNGSGNFNITDNYLQANDYGNIISDDTDADDFVSVASGNYSLKATASGVNKGLGFLKNIGGAGTLASTGVAGGGTTNYYFIARR